MKTLTHLDTDIHSFNFPPPQTINPTPKPHTHTHPTNFPVAATPQPPPSTPPDHNHHHRHHTTIINSPPERDKEHIITSNPTIFPTRLHPPRTNLSRASRLAVQHSRSRPAELTRASTRSPTAMAPSPPTTSSPKPCRSGAPDQSAMSPSLEATTTRDFFSMMLLIPLLSQYTTFCDNKILFFLPEKLMALQAEFRDFTLHYCIRIWVYSLKAESWTISSSSNFPNKQHVSLVDRFGVFANNALH
ncbi:hypothetical protein Acr_00g0079510 [Actinidia rufa]|uniref:Uncharacterized protein n=1 Tax=Actinidia rufa TaxID=165716 RepID=A0A7J0DTS5_9ERIC|nr:hypothetical protein Acr_00g0079510 [Actinidia rufa]